MFKLAILSMVRHIFGMQLVGLTHYVHIATQLEYMVEKLVKLRSIFLLTSATE